MSQSTPATPAATAVALAQMRAATGVRGPRAAEQPPATAPPALDAAVAEALAQMQAATGVRPTTRSQEGTTHG